MSKEGGAIQLGGRVEEGDVSELAHAIDGQEHVELAIRQAQLAMVDVDVADGGLGEEAALRAAPGSRATG